MCWKQVVVLISLTYAICCDICNFDPNFPPKFQFGVSTSAYQVEGGWNASDKGESIWDRLVHTTPDKIANRSNGDVACDSYHRSNRDIQMVTELGVDFYRFSISWSRLLPNGFPTHVSEAGRRYYSDLIDSLLARGIEPMVTLFHYDLPQIFQDLGGWANPLIADWFEDYARVVFTLFADRVKTWITINEPIAFCDAAYTAILGTDMAMYMCNKYMLMAHARAWRLYDKEFRPRFKGKVSFTNLLFWFEPLTKNDTDIAELARKYWEGRFTHPVFSKTGGWPPEVERIVAENSQAMGYSQSRMPAFTDHEKELVRGTFDFYALNHYSTFIVRKAKPGEVVPPYPFDGIPELGAVMVPDHTREYGGVSWCMVYPEGLRRQLQYIKRQYGDIEVKITENGYPSIEDDIYDYKRLKFIRGMLEQVLISIREDRVNVTTYSVWSLLDAFEWFGGYTPRFGLYRVNFSNPARMTTPRLSAMFYADVIKNHAIV